MLRLFRKDRGCLMLRLFLMVPLFPKGQRFLEGLKCRLDPMFRWVLGHHLRQPSLMGRDYRRLRRFLMGRVNLMDQQFLEDRIYHLGLMSHLVLGHR